MPSPDFFGISDRVRQLTAPTGMEAVHEDGFSWARQGTTWSDTTRIGPREWNRLIGNLRGIGLMPDTVTNEFDPAGPYVLREALVTFVVERVDINIAPYMASINAALALKAPLASPALTGTPTAPTPSNATNSTRIATTAYVKALFDDLYGGSVSSGFDTITEIEGVVATKAPLASPALTGTPTAPTPSNADNSTKLATTAYVKALFSDLYGGSVSSGFDTLTEIEAVVGSKAPLASPALTGTPTAPTPSNADNSTKLATTAYVKALFTDLYGGSVSSGFDTILEIEGVVATKAPLASPALTGTPTAPTPANATNSTQIATTAYVKALFNDLYGGSVSSGFDTLTEIEAVVGSKAPLASPALTGTPTAPTAATPTNTTQLATTAFVQAVVAALVDSSPAALNTLNELSAALGDDPNFATTITNALGLKAPLASPALTGVPTAPTASAATSTTQIATTAFVKGLFTDLYGGSVSSGFDTLTKIEAAIGAKAPLASPALTGTPTAPTAVGGTNTTQLATTAFVTAGLAPKAPLASPALTGTPTAPTPANADNSTKLATTAYVKALFDDLYGGSVSSGFDTLTEIEAAIGAKAPLASPALTGLPTAPTAAGGTNTTQLATTAFVTAGLAPKAPLASPALTGTPTAPTAATPTNTTQVATTAFVQSALSNFVEAGAWTPTFQGGTIGGSISYDQQIGSYVAIGRLVLVTFIVEAGAIFTVTPTGTLTIAGLPFPCDQGTLRGGGGIGAAGNIANLPANFGGWEVRLHGASSLGIVFGSSSTGAVVAANANILTADTIFSGTLLYRRA